jgi:hexosaminidase
MEVGKAKTANPSRPRFGSLLLALALSACATRGAGVTRPSPIVQPHPLIPLPASLDVSSGSPPFRVTADTAIVVPPDDARVQAIGRFLSDWIGIAAAPAAPRVEVAGPAIAPRGNIVLTLVGAATGEEGYELSITPEQVTIAAGQPAGLFYGVQTLRQLLPAFVEFRGVRPDNARPVSAPAMRIADRPRFAWRGAMLDVARHFFTVDEVKRYIDLMAMYKLNRLHLHLSDDQGWRIDITSWPNLTRVGGSTEVGGGPGGFYTQAQYTEIVEHATSRFITIVPEIDMPGHTNAAQASYAELTCDGKAAEPFTGTKVGFSALCVDSDVTYRFIDDVVREIAALTPGPYFHIGGDEVQQLTPPQYKAFIERVQAIVHSHGKQVVGWDEIAVADLLPTTLVQHWRPKESPAAAAARGAKVILSTASRLYIDMKYDAQTPIGLAWAGHIEARDAYDWDPATLHPGVSESSLIGIEAAVWAETVTNIRELEYLAFPRLAEIAEVAWSPASRRAWEDFGKRLGAQAPRWTALGINFYRSPQVDWGR